MRNLLSPTLHLLLPTLFATAAPLAAQTLSASGVERGGGTLNGFLGPTSAPELILEFPGARKSDPGTGSRADAGIAVGPDHVVELTNGNFSVFDKTDGTRLVNQQSSAVFGGSGMYEYGRIVFDTHSQRFLAATLVSDQVFVAVSETSDATGSWFAASFDPTQESDVNRNPDFLRMGFDENGLYVTLLMFTPQGTDPTSTIFAIDKAPLLEPAPSLGTVTAFRQIFHGFGIQPCATYGDSDGVYFVATGFFDARFRIYQLTGPLTAPLLFDLGLGDLQTSASIDTVPALGSTDDLNIFDYRFQNAVYHEGSIWTTRHSSSSVGHGVQWFELDADDVSLVQRGFVFDLTAETNYYLPSIAVNTRGDVLLSYCSSSETEYVGTFVSGRHATDIPGEMSAPALLRAGAGPQNPPGAIWGLHSDAIWDPFDPDRVWCAGIYARMNNRWGTRIAQYDFPCAPPTNYCAATPNSTGEVASISSTGTPSVAANGMVLEADDVPPNQFGVFYYGMDPIQEPFGDGFRCIGGMTFRLPVVAIEPTGRASLDFDLTDPPEPAGQIGAGDTWRFQFWYRDPLGAGAGFNLTDGLEIAFCP